MSFDLLSQSKSLLIFLFLKKTCLKSCWPCLATSLPFTIQVEHRKSSFSQVIVQFPCVWFQNFPFFSAHLKSPHGSSAKRPAAISRLPQLVRTPQRPAGLILSDLSNSGLKTPSSVQKKAPGLKSAYSAVASPVASYVRNNPAPHLVQ